MAPHLPALPAPALAPVAVQQGTLSLVGPVGLHLAASAALEWNVAVDGDTVG